jgi:hypothetical protein
VGALNEGGNRDEVVDLFESLSSYSSPLLESFTGSSKKGTTGWLHSKNFRWYLGKV